MVTTSRLRRLAHDGRLALLDAADLILGRRDPLMPSRRAIESIGGSDFTAIGQHLAEMAIRIAGLGGRERVLDVGCGYGRLAIPLAGHLGQGTYEGFDISPSAIRWCQSHITTRFPNMRFTHADVRNGHYNPRGTVAAQAFDFPYPSSSMDVVIAASVFTHLTADAANRYISESARVLQRGGRCLASFYLLDAESLALIRTTRTEPQFRVLGSETAVQRTEDPEAAVAFSEARVRSMFTASGLTISEIHTGGWRQRAGASYQDFILAIRP